MTAQGNHIVISVNGKTTTDYTDEKRLYSSGHIALQQHDPSTVAEFRKIEIKELNGTRQPNANVPGISVRPILREGEGDIGEGEGDIVNWKRDLDDLGDLARSAYVSYFMKTIHYVPLEGPYFMKTIHYVPLEGP